MSWIWYDLAVSLAYPNVWRGGNFLVQKLFLPAFPRAEEGGLGVGTLRLEGDGECERDDSESLDLLNLGERQYSMHRIV